MAIAAGRYNSLALQCDGTILAWGAGTTNSGTSPNFGQSIILPGLSRVKAIAAGGYHTLALEGDGGPSLTGTLHDQTVTAGEAVTYAAMAAGRQPMSYQWQFNGADLPGATAGVLNLTNVQAAQAGSYSVVISNDSGSVIGSAALVVLSAPVITEQPENQAVVEGAPVAFTVEAIGSAPLRYHWRYDGASIAGATDRMSRPIRTGGSFTARSPSTTG